MIINGLTEKTGMERKFRGRFKIKEVMNGKFLNEYQPFCCFGRRAGIR